MTTTILILGVVVCASALLVLALRWPTRPPVEWVENRDRKPGECTHYVRVVLEDDGDPVHLLFTRHEFKSARSRARKQPEDFA